jgi:hypothetical protein
MPDPNEISANTAMIRAQTNALREAARILADANGRANGADSDEQLRIMSAAVADALTVLQGVRS